MQKRPRSQHAATGVRAAGTPTPPPINCAANPVEGIKQMFVDQFQGSQIATGEVPATRPVFRRVHGVAHGTFVVRPDLPEALRVGVFGQRSEYPMWVRFSSDLQPGAPDYRGTVGIGIKIFGVHGHKVMEPDQDATTHDFILQNHDVFFVNNAKDMCEFSRDFNGFVKKHPRTSQILNEMEKVVNSVLETPYWGVLPTRFGMEQYAKYKIEPEVVPPGSGRQPDYDDPFYQRADLHCRMNNGEARLKFMVQLRTHPEQMPLDEATVAWSEELSPPIHVATLVLPRQDLDTRGQAEYGENLAINTWHALPELEPVGSLAEARKVTYRASARVRRDVNGVPLAEPVCPRPAEMNPGQPYPAARDLQIVRAEIHPAIGIARMGNSEEWFIGPEVTEPAPQKPGYYRDGSGALKRQAARFRIYGYNAAGDVVQELTSDYADIHWTAHVANRKAGWYQWVQAMDIPESVNLSVPLRNPDVTGAARRFLDIDGGTRTIEGKNTYGSEYRFEGLFAGPSDPVPVYLGELRTDENGRLLFLGSRGVSASPTNQPIYDANDPNGFINANGWYDDASDGPVTAKVVIDGREIPVQGAWVVTAPPNYAPDVVAVRTLYDLLEDLYIQNRWMDFPREISFTRHVYPILQRLSGLQWVNAGFATQFGHGGPNDFQDARYVRRLAHKPRAGEFDTWADLRRQVFFSFRPPQPTDDNYLPWPWEYGDADSIPGYPDSPRQNLSLSGTQYRILSEWADGNFTADWPGAVPVRDVDKLPVAEQPMMLTKAALHFCLADAFHPGCEVTWPIRHITMYSAPFRITHRAPGETEPDYGPTLTQAQVLAADGPLWAQGPGDLSRWMGLPWQEDTAFCRSGYEPSYDPSLPTFWPARVPNQVLTQADYERVMDTRLSREERQAAFNRRELWTRLLGKDSVTPPQVQMMNMVKRFGDMGVVEVRPGVKDDPDFPSTMMVENAVGVPAGTIPWRPELMLAGAPEMADASSDDAESETPKRRVAGRRFAGRAAHVRALAEATTGGASSGGSASAGRSSDARTAAEADAEAVASGT
ncbi:LodA/GoxA family CTQ-dependent oxidase [Longimicrobium sp.]|uniref:LodA/GoxA family CTQ-dependent oxidase n=1 Tax=Longimicrobium sp. TaxID=2029185 RepID=UPI002E312C80|nr:LodA/GoxA family CTQ-dependent oxidase [Longimicrobium sp.]HEX6037323.1 LodA/GoxA family CTQ-dependent oxidase [Longimicrobium sp.]